jgi:hypothetical protein
LFGITCIFAATVTATTATDAASADTATAFDVDIPNPPYCL